METFGQSPFLRTYDSALFFEFPYEGKDSVIYIWHRENLPTGGANDGIWQLDGNGDLLVAGHTPHNKSPRLAVDSGGIPHFIFLEQHKNYDGWPGTSTLEVTRTDPLSDTIWSTQISAGDRNFDRTGCNAITGGFYALGRYKVNATGEEFVQLSRLDKAGNILYGSVVPSLERANGSLEELSSAKLMYAEFNSLNDANQDGKWFVFDTAGTLIGSDTVPHLANGQIARLPDSTGFWMIGTYRHRLGDLYGVHIVRLDVDGEWMWEKFVDTPFGIGLVSINIEADGGFTIVSWTFGEMFHIGGWYVWNTTGPYSNLIWRFDSSGDSVWSREFLPGYYYHPKDHIKMNNGDYLISGTKPDSCWLEPVGPVCGTGHGFILRTDSLGRLSSALLEGMIYADVDGDLLPGPADYPIANRIIENTEEGFQTMSDVDGRYVLPAYDEGVHRVVASVPTYFTPALPAPDPEHFLFIDTTYGVWDSLDFAVTAPVPTSDLVITGYSGIVRPYEELFLHLSVLNNGTEPVDSLQLKLNYSDSFNYVSANPTPDFWSGTDPVWELFDLGIGESRTIRTTLYNPLPPPPFTLGSVWVDHLVSVEPVIGDATPKNNIDTFSSWITYSWDPNDKLVDPPGEGPEHIIDPETAWLTFTIRFQNTGTDTAFRVVIQDAIPETLELSSFEPLGASHPFTLGFAGHDHLSWNFDDIVLPDSSVSYAESQGFISFRIRPTADLPLGTRIENRASIFFDYNDAVVTDPAFVTLDRPSYTPQSADQSIFINVVPNPATTQVSINWSYALTAGARLFILDATGRIHIERTVTDSEAFINTADWPAGIYHVIVHSPEDAVVGRSKLCIVH